MEKNLCKLLPTNKRLKQLISVHGNVWTVKLVDDNIKVFNGPGVYIESHDQRHSRWVHPEDIEWFTSKQ